MQRSALLVVIVLLSGLSPAADCGGFASSPWSVLPLYGGGFVQNVVIAPSDPKVWYTYVDVAGPYRSDDAGMSWRPLHSNFTIDQRQNTRGRIRTLSVDPRDANNIIIIAGGEFSEPGGAFVSRDGGQSWRKTLFARFYGNGPSRMEGLCLARNPNNPDELIAGEDFDGLFRSTDNGETWQVTGPREHFFTDIRYDVAQPGRVYACAPDPKEIYYPKHIKPYALDRYARKSGFYASRDSGITWEKLSEFSPHEVVQIKGNSLLVGNFNRCTEVRASTDGGRTWFPFHEGLPVSTGKLDRRGLDLGRFHALGAGEGFFLIGSEIGPLYRREKDATCWRLIERELQTLGDPECELCHDYVVTNRHFEYFSSIVINPHDRRNWIATDWFFIWQSHDEGRTWVARNRGMMQVVSFDIMCDRFDPNKIIYSAADVGLFVSENGGKSFACAKGNPPYAQTLAVSSRTKGLMYGCGARQSGGIARSEDGGATWRWTENLSGVGRQKLPGYVAFGVAVDPVTDDVYVTLCGKCGEGKGGVYKSADRGRNWVYFSKGLPEGKPLFKDSEWSGGMARALVFSPDGSAVLTTPKTGEVWYLDRSAGIWKKSNVSSQNNIVIADPYCPGRFLKSGIKTEESVDGGRTFHALESAPGRCWSMAFDAHTSGLLVMHDCAHIYISRDAGRSFYVLPDDMAYPSNGGAHVYVDRKRLFAFAGGSGVWRRDLD